MTLDQTITLLSARGEQVQTTLRQLLCIRGTDAYAFIRGLGFEAQFEDPEFETILRRMLGRVPDSLDKRQGSIIYDALAPAAAELTEALIEREANRALSYASMSTGQWLDLRAAEHGLERLPATAAEREGLFFKDEEQTQPFEEVPIGAKLSLPDQTLNFTVCEKISAGKYLLRSSTAGAAANLPAEGEELIPVEYMEGCALALLGQTLTPGEEEETDEELYARFVQSITRPAFGGNRSDYENYFRTIQGIGPAKLLRATPTAGQVTAILLGADYAIPSQELIAAAQAAVDPQEQRGEGLGLAPMAHAVTVTGAAGANINVATVLTLAEGMSLGQIQQEAETAVEGYLLGLRRTWADYTAADSSTYVTTVVRLSQIEAAILNVEGITDITATTLNGTAANLTMEQNQVPILGEVSLSSGT
jgi:uncharacterized phage protein gp47/JayE